MRQLIILFLFIPTFAFSQLNQTDANGLRQGKWQKKQANGRLLYEGEFKDGKPVGEWKRFHPGGQVKAHMFYKGDTAQAVLYDVWRKKIAEGNYLNQKKEGLWLIYKNDKKVAEESYKNGLKHGLSKKFYNTYEVMEESDWVNGKQHGNYQVFYKSGQAYLQCKISNSMRDGLFLVNFENGQQQLIGAYKNNLRDGEWKYQNNRGEHLYSLLYNNGELLNPQVRDSVANIQMQDLEQNKGAILDPEKFMQDPSEYMMQNRQKR